jgi:formylglycine-generating enzyme required for sulfatase activity
MEQSQALSLLGLNADAPLTPAAIDAAYSAKQAPIQGLLDKAPTDALKAKYQTRLEQLNTAKIHLLGSLNQTANGPATSKPASLSQSKFDDLPSAQARHSQFEGQVKAELGLQAGQLLANRYEIREQIGAGGMGAVYSALDNNTGKEIAIKVLLPSLLKNERARERFMDEARLSQQLSHPNIVNVFDVQQDGDFFFLTMELLHGQDLRHVMENRKLSRQPFDVEEVQELLVALGEGLSYAHKHTVHRDLKPENIWLSEDGTYKIMDFGIARVQSTSQRTQTGAAMGTAYYMAPEQLKGQSDIDGRADQYALAVMAYELLTGEVPAGMIEPVRDHRKDVPKGMAEAVHQGLASRPDNRFNSVNDFVTALNSKGGSGISLPSFDVQKLALPGLIVLAVLLTGGLVSSGMIDFGKLFVSQEEVAQRKAASAKLLGEIKNYQRRLDNGRRQLNSDLRDASRNNPDQEKYLQHWQTLTDNYLFEGSQLTELEGELTMGESLLRENSFDAAEHTLTQVRDGYQVLWEQFSAAENLLQAEEASQAAHQHWTKSKRDYDLSDPQQVVEAQQAESTAENQQREGDFAKALGQWQMAEQSWRAAYSAVSKTVASIDSDRAQKAKAAAQAKAAAKKAAERKRLAAAVKKAIPKMVSIPAGSFMMGSNEYSNEKPIHRVSINAFKLSQTEVTFAQWDACVSAGGCSYKPDDEGWGRGSRPVINVSYNDITQQFIPWLNRVTGKRFRLPTEAEWEYAARAGTRTSFSTGHCITTSQANYNGNYDWEKCGAKTGNYRQQTLPVGSFNPNQFGLYDMHGNVWEWTQDCWNESYNGAPSNGRAWVHGDCGNRVVRGGSWNNIPFKLRSVIRDRDTTTYRGRSYGFRLAQDL